MPYMKCPTCQKDVSSTASRCPFCHTDLSQAGESGNSQDAYYNPASQSSSIHYPDFPDRKTKKTYLTPPGELDFQKNNRGSAYEEDFEDDQDDSEDDFEDDWDEVEEDHFDKNEMDHEDFEEDDDVDENNADGDEDSERELSRRRRRALPPPGRRLLGYRSGNPLFMIFSIFYHMMACVGVLYGYSISSRYLENGTLLFHLCRVTLGGIILFIPVLFLSETHLRRNLPLLRSRKPAVVAIGLLILYIPLTILFAMSWYYCIF